MTWLFWTLGALIALVGLTLLYRALLADRARGRKRCPKCWYDMSGVAQREGKHICPECGRAVLDERALRKTRRHWLPASAGAVVLALGLITLAFPLYINDVSITAIPRPLLVLGFDMLDENRKNEAWSHLESKLAEMAPWERRRAARIWTRRSLIPAIEGDGQRPGYWRPLAIITSNMFGAESSQCADVLMAEGPSWRLVEAAIYIDPTNRSARASALDFIASDDVSTCLAAHEAAHAAGIGLLADERLVAHCADGRALPGVLDNLKQRANDRSSQGTATIRPGWYTASPLRALGALIADPQTREATVRGAESRDLLERYFEAVARGESPNGEDAFLAAMLESGPPKIRLAAAALLVERRQLSQAARQTIDAFREYEPDAIREAAVFCAGCRPSHEFRRARHRLLMEAPQPCADAMWRAVREQLPGDRAELSALLINLRQYLAPEHPTEQRIRAARLLGSFGPMARAALPLLMVMLSDEEEHVRHAAQEAVRRIESADHPNP